MSRVARVTIAVAGALACLAAAGVAPLAHANETPARVKATVGLVSLAITPSTTLQLTGRGYGHGHGMSQYGAEGAAKQGITFDRILAFYYPGTRPVMTDASIRVLISADTSSDVVVQAEPGLTLTPVGTTSAVTSAAAIPTAPTDLTSLQPTAVKWRLRPLTRHGVSTTQLDWYDGSKWHGQSFGVGDFEFSAGEQAIRLYEPGKSVQYRGALRSATPKPGSKVRDTVNVLPLDEYVQGVVPSEMPALWQIEALKAQAVAARTYAAFEMAESTDRYYDICDTSSCQVYRGYDNEHQQSNVAVTATAGEILVDSKGQPAFTQFSASDGGYETAGSRPYLVSQADPYDIYPTWTGTLSAKKIHSAWPQIGTLQQLQVLARDGDGDFGGRVTTLLLVGSKGSITVSGTTFESKLGLRSTLFSLTGPALPAPDPNSPPAATATPDPSASASPSPAS